MVGFPIILLNKTALKIKKHSPANLRNQVTMGFVAFADWQRVSQVYLQRIGMWKMLHIVIYKLVLKTTKHFPSEN